MEDVKAVTKQADKSEVSKAVSLVEVATPLDNGDVIPGTVKAFVIGEKDYVGHGTISRAFAALKDGGSFYVAKGNALEEVVSVYCGNGEDADGEYRKFVKA